MARWNTDRPIKELPYGLRMIFTQYADAMLKDLKTSTPGVVLVPAPVQTHSGHRIRQSQNPKWYRELYHGTPHFRRDRSMRALERIYHAEDRPFNTRPYKYDSTYRELISAFLKSGCDEYGIPPYDDETAFLKIDRSYARPEWEVPEQERRHHEETYDDDVPF